MMSVAGDAAAPAGQGPKLDTTVSHSARIWNYWLGGKDNFAVDRAAGDKVAAMLPSIVAQARADRAFLGRAVSCSRWRPYLSPVGGQPAEVDEFCGVARKPSATTAAPP